MIYLRAAHHVIVQGFNIQGSATPGDLRATGPWAGIMLDGDFGRTGALAPHIAVVGNFSHNHVDWGLHSTDTHSVLLEDNVFGLSAMEHSAYVSDGSDNYVIRRNIFFGSRSSGLQCNLDPEASLQEVMKHAAFRDAPPFTPSRAWADLSTTAPLGPRRPSRPRARGPVPPEQGPMADLLAFGLALPEGAQAPGRVGIHGVSPCTF